MTPEIDRFGVFAEEWGRKHHSGINSDFVDLIREKIPAEAAVPSVLGVIFHTSQTTMMMHELLVDRPEQGSSWEGILENVIDHAFQQSGPDRMMTAFVRMSLAQSVRGKEEWDLAKSPARKWYEYLVEEGVLVKTSDRKFKLDGDLQRIFGPTIVKKADEWIGHEDLDRFLDNVVKGGPIFVP